MFRLRFFIASVLLFSVVGSASGELNLFGPSDRTGYWDFGIQTRYTGSKDFHGDQGARLSLEDNLGWGFNAAYNLNERLNVGAFAAWRSVDYSAHIFAPDLDRSVEFSGWMETANIGVNATVNVLKTRFTPYLTGGVGWAMVDTNIPAVPGAGCWWDPWWGYICLDSGANIGDDASSYTLGGGLSLQVTETFFIRAGYEKSWIDLDVADDFDIIRIDLGFLHR